MGLVLANWSWLVVDGPCPSLLELAGGMRPFSSGSCSLAYSISEEDTGSLRSDSEGRSGNRVGRTFSYLKNKMTRKSRKSAIFGSFYAGVDSTVPGRSKAVTYKLFCAVIG
ncbi:unnamed protein product [Gadus morhua 'NCC']